MEEEGGPRGGSVGDMQTLQYWSRVSFWFLIAGGAVWAAFGAYRLYRGLSWYQLDELSGSTRAVADLSWGIACMALAVLSFLIAGRLRLDIISVFRQMRFQVPREKLAVYGLLGFPLGLVLAGVLLVLVNFKLSRPEFLPSHAEAYPEVFYAARPPPVAEGAPAAPEAGAPAAAEAATEPLVEVGPPPTLVYAPAPVPAAPEPVPAIYEDVGAEAPPAPAALPRPAPAEAPAAAPAAAAVYEEVPVPTAVGPPPAEPAPVMAVVEEAPEQLEAFEEVPPAATVEELPEEATAPKDIKSAHEELMKKLLGKG